VSFQVARRNAITVIGQGGSTSAALVVALGLPVGLISGQQTVATALRSGSISAGTVGLILGGPVLLAAVGSAAGLLMTARNRAREIATLIAIGGTHGLALAVAVLEGLVILVSASLLTMIVAVATGLSEWAALVGFRPETAPHFAVSILFGAALVSLPLLLAASLVPMILATRQRLAE
jgi:putative ABC transport system permease protein